MASSIQVLRSTTAKERPFPGNLLEGQPAVNVNATEPGLFFKASDGSLFKIGPIAITSDGAPPNTGGVGQQGNCVGELWLDKSVSPPILKIYDGAQWVDAGSGGGGGALVTLQRWQKSALGGETTLSGADDSSPPQALEYTPGLEEVFVNGALLVRGSDYSAIAGTTITGLTPLAAGDAVVVLGWKPFNVAQLSITNADVSNTAAIEALKLSFTQPYAGAQARTVQSKLEDVIDIRDFGAACDGVTDDTQALADALAACTGGRTLHLYGSILFSEPMYPPSSIGGIVGEGMTKTVLIFNREQGAGDGHDNSAIVIDNGDGITVRDLKLEYTGTFNPGASYDGKVSGFYLDGCSNCIIQRVEATGFNAVGVNFYRTGGGVSSQDINNKVTHCWLHHNRRAGVYYAYQKAFTIEFNLLEGNGIVTDGGTGYGCAATSSGYEKDVVICGNITLRNFRKGIDIHNGDAFTIANNRCVHDRIYPIGIESDGYAMRSLTVVGNVIEVDPDFYLSSDPYQFLQALFIGLNPFNVPAASAQTCNVVVKDNIIRSLASNNPASSVLGIYAYARHAGETVFDISNNQIRGGDIVRAIQVERIAGSNGGITAFINNNSIHCGGISLQAIRFRPNNAAGLNPCRAHINGNIISGTTLANNFIALEAGLSEVRVSGNSLTAASIAGYPILISSFADTQVWVENNLINAGTWSSTGSEILYGNNRVVAGGNTFNGSPIACPTRISDSGGSTNSIKVLKSLAVGANNISRVGRYDTSALYTVKWSAWSVESGPASTQTAGGTFTFVSAYTNNNQGTFSPISVLSSQSSDNGGTPISVTWSIATDIVSQQYLYKLVATSNKACGLFCEIEMVAALDITAATISPAI